MVELLAPAGSYESLKAAVKAGADAVYIGGSMFGARAYADNPDEAHLIDGIEYCHLHGKKLYMTVNTLLKQSELEHDLYDYLLPYYEHGVDALIVQDLGVVSFVQKYFSGLEIHGSTQMTVTGPEGAALLQREGITRVVPARELSLKEVSDIIEATGMEVETFIHGAMCYSYSGQCLFSSMLGGRSGNRGRCAQPCRLPYRLSGPDGKNYAGYLLSMKDMCTLDLIPEMVDAGIASMKIEGRMKRPEYTAGVVSIYRKYIDLYEKKGHNGFAVQEDDKRILMDLYNRGGFSGGYYHMHNGKTMMALSRPNHQGTEAAKVKAVKKGSVTLTALEQLKKGDVLELDQEHNTTMGQEIGKHGVFQISVKNPSLRPGSVVYRTKNESLLQELGEKFLNENYKEKIKGELTIFKDSPAILRLWNDLGTVTVSQPIAEPAKNSSTTEEAVRKQMMKTGNTPFEFSELHIKLDQGLFIPVSKLNELRRKGLEMLGNCICEKSFRGSPSRPDKEKLRLEKMQPVSSKEELRLEKIQPVSPKDGLRMAVSVMTWDQLKAVLSFASMEKENPVLGTVYFDTMLFGDEAQRKENTSALLNAMGILKEKNIKACINCPPVWRERERALFADQYVKRVLLHADGFLIHTIDQLSFFKGYILEEQLQSDLIADDNLYACNALAFQFLQRQGVVRQTLSAELNFRELQQLMLPDCEIVVYGHQPLMHSAQCVVKNTSGCKKRPGVTYLQDRKNVKFPVVNRCPVCCNTIYNSVPLMLGGCRKELETLMPSVVRLSFTVESGEETAQVLSQYKRLLFDEDSREDVDLGGTRGHFKRGVE